MTHLISPWVFYWMEVLVNVQFLLALTGVLGMIGCGFLFMVSYDNVFAKKTIIACALMVLIATFIPSQKTMYTMLVVDQITVENIGTLKQSTTELVDYVIEKVDTLLEEEKGDK